MDDMMSQDHKDVLERLHSTLVEGISLNVSLWSRFRDRGIITAVQEETLKYNNPPTNQVHAFLTYLRTRPDKDFYGFLNSLNDTNQDHIVRLIHKELPQTIPDQNQQGLDEADSASNSNTEQGVTQSVYRDDLL